MKKALLILFLGSVIIANAGPFALGGWYEINLTSGKMRRVIVNEIKEDCIRVSPCDSRLQGEEYMDWVFIRNIESFNRFNLKMGEPDK